jgi:hypothetical protein
MHAAHVCALKAFLSSEHAASPAAPFAPILVFNIVHIFSDHPLGNAKVADRRLWQLVLEALRGVVSARRRRSHPWQGSAPGLTSCA